jgi:hypothetical protein
MNTNFTFIPARSGSKPKSRTNLRTVSHETVLEICLVSTSLGKKWQKVRVAAVLADIADIESAKRGVLKKCNVGSELSIAYLNRASFGVYKSAKSASPVLYFTNGGFYEKNDINDRKVRIVCELSGLSGHINNGVMGILTLFRVMAIEKKVTDCAYIKPYVR